MIAMDPAVPDSGPSSLAVIIAISLLLFGVVGAFAWNLWRAEPVGRPVEQPKPDGFDQHADEAAEVTRPAPSIDSWLPPRRPASLPYHYRIAFDRIAERLLRDGDFADLIHHIEECQ